MRSASQIVAQVPSRAQRRLRWYTVFHGPNRAGRSRQVIPVRSRHKIHEIVVR